MARTPSSKELTERLPGPRFAIEQGLALGIDDPSVARASLFEGAVIRARAGGAIAEIIVRIGAFATVAALARAIEGATEDAEIDLVYAARRGWKRDAGHRCGEISRLGAWLGSCCSAEFALFGKEFRVYVVERSLVWHVDMGRCQLRWVTISVLYGTGMMRPAITWVSPFAGCHSRELVKDRLCV